MSKVETNSVLSFLASWKTSLTGLLAGLIMILNQFGIVHITGDQQATLIAATVILIGIFSKDADKSGVEKA